MLCDAFGLQQPSAEVFYDFDQMLLLQRGGDMVYFGSIRDRAKPMVTYLEAVSGSKLPPRVNPANWMLDVLSAYSDSARHANGFTLQI